MQGTKLCCCISPWIKAQFALKCDWHETIRPAVSTVIMGTTVQYTSSFKDCACGYEGPLRFVLTSPGESAQLWFPWRTQVSFEGNEADWSSPSAGSGSQTAPGGWTPDSPVNHEGERKHEGYKTGGGGTSRLHTVVI